MDVINLNALCSRYIACAEITGEFGRICAVSIYCRETNPMDFYMEQIKRILERLRGRRIVFGLDANTSSPMWFSKNGVLDANGESLENLIV